MIFLRAMPGAPSGFGASGAASAGASIAASSPIGSWPGAWNPHPVPTSTSHAPFILLAYRTGRGSGQNSTGTVERAGANVAQLAALALSAPPDPLEHALDLIEQRRVIGDDAELEVAPARTLRTE